MAAWFVYDSDSETQYEIDPAKLQALVQGIPQNRLGKYHFWREGMGDWLPLDSLPELMSLRKAAPPPPPRKTSAPPPAERTSVVPLRPQASTSMEHPEKAPQAGLVKGVKGQDLGVQKQLKNSTTPDSQDGAVLLFDEPLVGEPPPPPAEKGTERRRSARENVRFRVMFTWDDVVFRTFSKDLSAHGLKVEHTVPESMINRQVDCYISSPDMKSGVRFKAVLIEDQKDRLRFRFVDENSKAQRVLQDWFEMVRRSRTRAS